MKFSFIFLNLTMYIICWRRIQQIALFLPWLQQHLVMETLWLRKPYYDASLSAKLQAVWSKPVMLINKSTSNPWKLQRSSPSLKSAYVTHCSFPLLPSRGRCTLCLQTPLPPFRWMLLYLCWRHLPPSSIQDLKRGKRQCYRFGVVM